MELHRLSGQLHLTTGSSEGILVGSTSTAMVNGHVARSPTLEASGRGEQFDLLKNVLGVVVFSARTDFQVGTARKAQTKTTSRKCMPR